MCGRSNILPDADAWVEFFSLIKGAEMEPNYDVTLGADVPAVRLDRDSERELFF